eukprot:XP_001710241.1 Hypothetical protein GL50803_38465 [Giardia lamblia ATCC 50803]
MFGKYTCSQVHRGWSRNLYATNLDDWTASDILTSIAISIVSYGEIMDENRYERHVKADMGR